MRETKADFLEWQREQLFAGKKSNGTDIRPRYHPRTITMKRIKGQPYDRVTVKDTGFFYQSLYLVLHRDSMTYDVVSSDAKSTKLIDRYGPKILGLGGIFLVGYRQDVRPVFYNRIKRKLLL